MFDEDDGELGEVVSNGNRITRTNGAGNSISQQEYKIRNIMPKILIEADDLQPGTAHTILRESVLSHMLR